MGRKRSQAGSQGDFEEKAGEMQARLWSWATERAWGQF